MATRTQARESVVGLLYAYDLGNTDIAKYSDIVLEDKKIRNKQKDFALGLFEGTMNNLEDIDKIISDLKRSPTKCVTVKQSFPLVLVKLKYLIFKN